MKRDAAPLLQMCSPWRVQQSEGGRELHLNTYQHGSDALETDIRSAPLETTRHAEIL